MKMVFKQKAKKLAILLLCLLTCVCLALLCGCSNNKLSNMIADAQSGDTVVLQNDMTSDNKITVDKNLTIDLGGKTLLLTKSIIVNEGVTLTLKNGKIMGKESMDFVFVNNGKMIVECVIKADDSAECIQNKGDLTLKKGAVTGKRAIINDGKAVVDGGILYGIQDYAIINNGNLTINGGTVGNSILTKYGTLELDFGVENNGTTTINNGHVGTVYNNVQTAKAYFFGGRIESIFNYGYAEVENKNGNLLLAGASPLTNEGTAVIKSGKITDIYDEGYASNGAHVNNGGVMTIYGGEFIKLIDGGSSTTIIYDGKFAEAELQGYADIKGGTFDEQFVLLGNGSADISGGTFAKGIKITQNEYQNNVTFTLADLLADGCEFDVAVDLTQPQTDQKVQVKNQ